MPFAIAEVLNNGRAADVSVHPCDVNRASSIGDVCERRLCLERLEWQQKLLPDAELASRFYEGRLHEEATLGELIQRGFIVFREQRAFEITGRAAKPGAKAPLLMRGHVDFFLKPGPTLVNNGNELELVPAEHKALSPNLAPRIETLNDMLYHPYDFVKKYPAQLLSYMYATDSAEGVMLIKNKGSGQFREIWVVLNDYLDYVEGLLQKAERINEAVKSGVLPCGIGDPEVCFRCDLRHVCNPDLAGSTVGADFTGELLDIILEIDGYKAERSLYKEADKGYDKARDRLKAKIKAADEAAGEVRDSVIVGEYLVSFKKVPQKAREASSYRRMTIKHVGGDDDSDD